MTVKQRNREIKKLYNQAKKNGELYRGNILNVKENIADQYGLSRWTVDAIIAARGTYAA